MDWLWLNKGVCYNVNFFHGVNSHKNLRELSIQGKILDKSRKLGGPRREGLEPLLEVIVYLVVTFSLTHSGLLTSGYSNSRLKCNLLGPATDTFSQLLGPDY